MALKLLLDASKAANHCTRPLFPTPSAIRSYLSFIPGPSASTNHSRQRDFSDIEYGTSRQYAACTEYSNVRNVRWRAPPISAGWGLNIEFEHGFGGKLRWLIRLQTGI